MKPEIFDLYSKILAKLESSNNPRAINTLGYAGLYQFGASALQDLGLVKPKTRNRDLTNPDVWTGKWGINSLEDFLTKPDIQTRALKEFTTRNENILRKAGVLSNDPIEAAAQLAAAHLGGPGSIINLIKKGEDFSDAYGTTVSSRMAKFKQLMGNTSLL